MSWKEDQKTVATAMDRWEPEERLASLEGALSRVEGRPFEIVARLALARLKAEGGETGEALNHLNAALQAHPGHAPLLLKVAFALRDEPELDGPDATDALQTPEALPRLHVPELKAPAPSRLLDALFPGRSTRTAVRLAHRLAEGEGGWRAACDCLLRELLRIPPNRLSRKAPALLCQLSCCLDLCERFEEAAEIALFAARRFPDAHAVRAPAARLACQVERWDEAEKVLKPVFETKWGASNRVARGCEALAKIGRGDMAGGWDILKEAGVPHGRDYLAELTLRMAPADPRFSKGTQGFEPQPLRLPSDREAGRRASAAEARLMVEDFEGGLSVLDEGGAEPLDAAPTAGQAHWLGMRGYALFRTRRFEEAANHFAAALAANPSDEWALAGFGESAMFAGDPASGVESLLEIAPSDFEDFGAHFHLGLAYWRLGRTTEARRALREAYRRYFDDSFVVALEQMRQAVLETPRNGQKQAAEA